MTRAAELAALVRAARERSFPRCRAHGELDLGMRPCRFCQLETILGRAVRTVAEIMA